MRKVLFYLSFMLLGVYMPMACSSDSVEDLPYSLKYGDIHDQEGIVHYDENCKYWYIFINNKNSNGVTTRLYFSESPMVKEYLIEGLDVIVSGEVYDFLISIDVPVGTQYYGFEIDSIIKK